MQIILKGSSYSKKSSSDLGESANYHCFIYIIPNLMCLCMQNNDQYKIYITFYFNLPTPLLKITKTDNRIAKTLQPTKRSFH